MEETLLMIKPDSFERRHVGNIILNLEYYKPVTTTILFSTTLTREEAEELYSCHRGKHFYDRLIEFTISGPVLFIKLTGSDAVSYGRNAVEKIRILYNDDSNSEPTRNLIHGSDSVESAKRELSLIRRISKRIM